MFILIYTLGVLTIALSFMLGYFFKDIKDQLQRKWYLNEHIILYVHSDNYEEVEKFYNELRGIG